jgi:hypothetical protein
MDWSVVVSAISTIVVAWFGYNQYTKNAETDRKIEKLKTEDKKRNKRRADNSIKVMEALWNVLYSTKASRVYIVQPHPLGNEELLTIYFEVKRSGIEAMKPYIQKMKIGEVALFAAMLEKNLFKVIHDVENDIEDRYAQSLFGAGGTKTAIIKRLSDNRYDWVGSIIVEFCHDVAINEEEVQHILHTAATNIQYILPEIEEE